MRLLFRLYTFLARRTASPFHTTVAHRLCMSRTNRPPISIARILRFYTEEHRSKGRIAVVVGSVLDDERRLRLPSGIRLCALRVTHSARTRIEAAGGEVMTFDQLAMVSPRGENIVLLRGPKHARGAYKHFVGVMGRDKVRPYTRAKGRKFERARGRRRSRGFKV